MKAPDELTFDESVKYSKEHTWAKIEGDAVFVGISDYAQDQLGDIVFIELPPKIEQWYFHVVFIAKARVKRA